MGIYSDAHPRGRTIATESDCQCNRHQPQAVSQAFTTIRWSARRGRLRAENRSALIERWLAGYPGPGGATTYWFALQSVLQQGDDARELAAELAAEPLLSGDSAADEYAPWRLPDRAVLYMRETVDLTPAGFTPATSTTPHWP